MNIKPLVAVLFLVAALANLNGLALYPFLTSIASDFDTSVAVIGQATTIALIAGAIIGLVVGPLADRFGHRRFLIVGMMLMSLSCAGTALASSYEMLLAVRFPGGLATGIMMGIGTSIATTRLVEAERRSAIGWIVSGAALGAASGPPIMALIAGSSDWRVSFGFLATAPIVLAIACLRIISPDAATAVATSSIIQSLADYRGVLSDRRSVLLLAGMFFWAVPVVGGSTYFGAYLIEAHGFSVTGAGFGYMWAASWMMVGPRLGIRLLEIIDLYSLIVIAGISLTVTTSLLFWMPLGLPWIAVFMALWPLNFGLGNAMITSAISEAAPAGQGTAMMARQFSWAVGGATSVAAGGALISVGGYTLFGLAAAFSALVVTVLVGLASRPRSVEPQPATAPASSG
jgi:MFS transporter, DHA1 family, multidrug resistance protein